MSGYGSDAYGQMPYGSGSSASPPPPTYFGIESVSVMDTGWLRVFFTLPVTLVPDLTGIAQIYVPSNYVFSVRFGRAPNIFALSVVPEDSIAPSYVDVFTAIPMANRGQYRLTVYKLMSITGISIETPQ